jgi:hypothetical protein
MTRLGFNPGPLVVVEAAVRDVWRYQPSGWRCFHEDGRGRCTSRETARYEVDGASEWLCPQHAPPGAAVHR